MDTDIFINKTQKIFNFLKFNKGKYIIFGDIPYIMYNQLKIDCIANINIYKDITISTQDINTIDIEGIKSISSRIHIHNENYTINQILNSDKEYMCNKILLRYIETRFEYCCTDECLWYMTHRLCNTKFNGQFFASGLRCLHEDRINYKDEISDKINKHYVSFSFIKDKFI